MAITEPMIFYALQSFNNSEGENNINKTNSAVSVPGDSTGRGRGPVQPESQGVALVELSASLVSPGVQVTPSLNEVQEAINKVAKIILSTAMGVSQWVRCRKEDVSRIRTIALLFADRCITETLFWHLYSATYWFFTIRFRLI